MKIKDIKVGNYVLSRNPNGKLEYKKVVNTFDNGKQTVYRFTLENGTEIKSTFDHRFMTESRTYEPIGALDNIIVNNKAVKISKVEELGNDEVYDIEVQDNHNFFVKGCEVSNCRAGAQTPFSSINYGTGTTEECRMIIKSVLKATDEGLGHGETAIFPVQIFRLHKGVNMEKGDPNYDLFEYACKVSAKRLFPNFEYLDVPFNLQYYKEGHPETEIAVMGCCSEHETITYKLDEKIYDNVPIVEAFTHLKSIFGDYVDNGKSEYVLLKNVQILDKDGFVECKGILMNHDVSNWVEVETKNHKLMLTDDHPLMVKDKGRTFVKDMNVGDVVYG